MSLRRQLIRLAHTKPELRSHLLPLLASSRQAYYLPDPLTPIFDKSCHQIRRTIDSITQNDASQGYNDLDKVEAAISHSIEDLYDLQGDYGDFEPAMELLDEWKEALEELQQEVERYKMEIDDQALYDYERGSRTVVEFMGETVVYGLESSLDDIERMGQNFKRVDREAKKEIAARL